VTVSGVSGAGTFQKEESFPSAGIIMCTTPSCLDIIIGDPKDVRPHSIVMNWIEIPTPYPSDNICIGSRSLTFILVG
jgi:hypothetical protein